MKKKLALLLSAIMVVGMIPMTAFAASDARVTRVATGKVDSTIGATDNVNLLISGKDYVTSTGGTFQLSLENAEWTGTIGGNIVTPVIYHPTDSDPALIVPVGYTMTKLSDTLAVVTYTKGSTTDTLELPMVTKLTNGGQAKVTINPMETILSAGTYVFANVVDGATTTTIESLTDIQEIGTPIKSIIIQESVAGALKWSTPAQVSANEQNELTLKLTNGFEFVGTGTIGTVTIFPGGTTVNVVRDGSDPAVATIKLPVAPTPVAAATLAINGISVKFDGDDVSAGDVVALTISGADMTRATVDVGTAREYGVTFKAENKTLPVFYSGRADKDTDTLKVTFEETILNSWLESRRTTITFPDGVKVSGIQATPTRVSGLTGVTVAELDQKARTTVVNFTGTKSGRAKIEFVFQLSIAPDFTGDIVATLGGAGVGEDMEVVIGTVVAPFTVEAETNEVNIDYREVSVSDIIITEADTGLFERNKILTIALDYISFDGRPSIEVVEGDIRIESIKTTGGKIEIEVRTATQRTPAVLKISNLNLFLQRSIPAGSYELSLVHGSSDTFFQNHAAGTTLDPVTGTTKFRVDEVVILEDYVEVVTAGRDQDDSTFTTTLTVTIGADTLTAGRQVIALDVPAYISEGYTMLPVRAVTEALSGAAIVRWDDATKTVTITFGSRVISMTVGSKTMNINGVPVQMSKACEITESRSFIPLRDLGYALGLNDSKINWDDATKTASLN